MKSKSQSKAWRPRLRVRSLRLFSISGSRSMLSGDCCLIMAASVSANYWSRARRSCSLISTMMLIGVCGNGDASKLRCDGWCELLPGFRVGVDVHGAVAAAAAASLRWHFSSL
eukprot:2911038-Pleurochrysis_carterae.AAC.2